MVEAVSLLMSPTFLVTELMENTCVLFAESTSLEGTVLLVVNLGMHNRKTYLLSRVVKIFCSTMHVYWSV